MTRGWAAAAECLRTLYSRSTWVGGACLIPPAPRMQLTQRRAKHARALARIQIGRPSIRPATGVGAMAASTEAAVTTVGSAVDARPLGVQGLPVELLQHVRACVWMFGARGTPFCSQSIGGDGTPLDLIDRSTPTRMDAHRWRVSVPCRTSRGSMRCARAGTTGWARRPRPSTPR